MIMLLIVIKLIQSDSKRIMQMLKFMLMSGVFSVMLVSAVNAQNVTVSDDVFGKNDEIGTKSVQPSVSRVYKIDNAAKKKVELNQNDIKNSSEQSEGLKKNGETSEEAITDTENKTSDFKPYIGGYKKRSLEEIQAGAFYKCERLKKIIIPKRVKKIPYRTFAECSALEYVELSGVEKIGSFAFAECTSLKEVIFSTNEIQIESYAFVDCNSLEKLINSENIVKFEDNVFSKCLSIKKFRFGDKVTHISNNIFYGCSSLEEVYIPDSVWMIGDNAFYLCPLKRVTISERRINLLCKSFIPNREPISPETFKKVNFVLL